MAARRVEFFGLSTCVWCRKAKAWLDDHGVQYESCYVDLLAGAEREAAMGRLRQHVSRESYPTLVIDDGRAVIQGYAPERYEQELR
jgi:glutaredoxin